MLLYSAFIFISLVFLDRFIFQPIMNKLEILNREIQDQETIIKENFRIIARKDKISQDLEKYSSYIGKELSDEEEIVSLLKQIESFAKEFSFILIEIKPTGVKEEGGVKKYGVDITYKSKMSQAADFIYKIENSCALLAVEKFNIKPRTENSDILNFTMTISKIVIP